MMKARLDLRRFDQTGAIGFLGFHCTTAVPQGLCPHLNVPREQNDKVPT
jgi:hypothetical protein